MQIGAEPTSSPSESRSPQSANGSGHTLRGSSNTRTKILVVDDDRAIRESLERLLGLQGYEAEGAADGAQAVELVRSGRVGLVIMDVMMPVMDGLTACRFMRDEGMSIPILMLTARTQTSDRVLGLDAGADDYLSKPFDPPELLARVRALLRRTQVANGPVPVDGSTTLRIADLVLDPEARRCWRSDAEISLTRIEFDLLELLMLNSGIVLSRSSIYEQIWGYDFGPDSKNLAVYIRYLRRKIDEGHEVGLIHTVRGVGYTLREP